MVIEVSNLSKKYIIGHQRQGSYQTLRDTLAHTGRSLWQRLRHPLSVNRETVELEEFWALKDVNFQVQQGDCLGIIGRNGAGKSTLLKILSRITEPTTGRIHIKGRIASLLEVGTGFHPELTGRENIFLNGAILGMTRQEIKRKFDEIVAFAEVEKFLDTPVKRYSSGMYVRLGFAVAAHLDPEILIVDEVLAVGDAAFQKKCLGKMGEIGKSGRTVLFISHQMGMIAQLCNRALILSEGCLIKQGETEGIISTYLKEVNYSQNNQFIKEDIVDNDRPIYITECSTVNQSDVFTSEFSHREPICLSIRGKINKCSEDYQIFVAVQDQQNRRILTTRNILEVSSQETPINWQATILIPSPFLAPGTYSFIVTIYVPKPQVIERLDQVCRFTVIDMGSEFAAFEGLGYGCVFADCKWHLHYCSDSLSGTFLDPQAKI